MSDVGQPEVARAGRWIVMLAGFYALAVVIYGLLGASQEIPLITPDEFTYGHLARSIAHGGDTTFRGEANDLRAALYIYAVAPAWLIGSATKAYSAAKIEGAFLLSLAIVPTWFLARRFVGPKLALIPAVLCIAGSWMTTSAGVLTENLAYPLATAALAVLVIAITEPGGRAGWVALGFALLASWARLQCVVLIPIMASALVLTPRPGGSRRSVLQANRRLVALAGGVSLLGIVVALADPGALGNYTVLAKDGPSMAGFLAAIGHQWVGLVVMAGLVPVPIVLAASLNRAAWRDPGVAALLTVTWAAGAIFVLQSAWAIAVLHAPWHIQRYVEYVVPLLLTTTVVVTNRGLVARRAAAAAVVLTAGLLLLAPGVRQVIEERGAFALALRGDDVLGASAALSMALATLVAGGVWVLAALWPGGARRAGAVAALALVTGTVFLVQDQAGWKWQLDFSRATRTTYPRDLTWLDHAGKGPVAHLIAGASAGHLRITDFFNRDIEQVYLTPQASPVGVRGQICSWVIQPAGEIAFSGPCKAPAQRFYFDDGFAHVSLYGERVEARDPIVGKVVRVSGAPRVRSIINLPCQAPAPSISFSGRGAISHPPRQCAPQIQGQLFLDQPGTVELRFRGDGAPHTVIVGTKRFPVAEQGVTTVAVRVSAGAPTLAVQLDWDVPTPAVAGIDLVQGGRRSSLL